jgi:hypothetical protein
VSGVSAELPAIQGIKHDTQTDAEILIAKSKELIRDALAQRTIDPMPLFPW